MSLGFVWETICKQNNLRPQTPDESADAWCPMECSAVRQLGSRTAACDDSCMQASSACFHVRSYAVSDLILFMWQLRKRHIDILGDQTVVSVREGNEMAVSCPDVL